MGIDAVTAITGYVVGFVMGSVLASAQVYAMMRGRRRD